MELHKKYLITEKKNLHDYIWSLMKKNKNTKIKGFKPNLVDMNDDPVWIKGTKEIITIPNMNNTFDVYVYDDKKNIDKQLAKQIPFKVDQKDMKADWEMYVSAVQQYLK